MPDLADLFNDDPEIEEADEVDYTQDLELVASSASPETVKTKEGRNGTGGKAQSPITVTSGSESSGSRYRVPARKGSVKGGKQAGGSNGHSEIDKGKGKVRQGRMTRDVEYLRRKKNADDSEDEAEEEEEEEEERKEEDSSLRGTRSSYSGSSSSGSGPQRSRKESSRRAGRKEVIVEIPFKPLSELKSYLLPSSIRPPNVASRKRLLNPETDEEDYVSVSSSSEIISRPKRQGPTWKTAPEKNKDWMKDVFESGSEDGNYRSGNEDVGDELDDSDEEDYGDSEDSDIALRRSKRKRGEGSRRNHQPSPRRTRGRERDTRSSKPARTGTAMKPEQRGSRKTYQGDDEDSEISNFEASEGEEEIDELDEEEYQLESSEHSEDSDAKPSRRARDETEDYLSKHRQTCEKCQRQPAAKIHENAQRLKRKGGKRKRKDDDALSDGELTEKLGGWLECRKCAISSHWGCLSAQQQKEVLNELLLDEGPPREGERKRKYIDIDENYHFTCSRCSVSPTCLVCHSEKLKEPSDDNEAENGDAKAEDKKPEETEEQHLLFRCLRCKQACHYEHHPFEDDEEPDLQDIAGFYQKGTTRNDRWLCHQCHEWIWNVEIICAWRPWPANAKEPAREPGVKPSWKDNLPREYLVKWAGRGFRHATWVTHPWLVTIAGGLSGGLLRNFLEKGPSLDLITDETLAAKGDEMAQPTIAHVLEESEDPGRRHKHGDVKDEWEGHGPPPDVDAESSIPQEWRTVDRVLDVYLCPPPTKTKGKQSKTGGSASTSRAESETPVNPAIVDGIEPHEDDRCHIDEWEEKTDRELTGDDLEEIAPKVVWCFVKWDDLQYDQSCWDTPPPANSSLYPAFKRALRRYLDARRVNIPLLSRAQIKERDADISTRNTPPKAQPGCIVGGKLMDFQLEGFQWLLYKHYKRESCILADDMGLGKTIQIASLLGYLGSKGIDIYPMLVVVPNSTITNWVREFEKWVPHMRVVPFYGMRASRNIISKYELYHAGMQNKAAGLKAHVVLTTYDTITSADFRIFSGIPRWEVLCVDEGQRLKSDSNLIFNRLKSLNSVHRILLTGTPLNNNLRELFNLLNFLDRENFAELADLEARFANLNEGLIQELHVLIRPYILRRIKADVLKLPPKIEIIVPISLSPLQKNVYRTILEKNGDVLKAIAEARRKKKKAVTASGGEIIDGRKNKKKKKSELDDLIGGTKNAQAALDGTAEKTDNGKGDFDQSGINSPTVNGTEDDAAIEIDKAEENTSMLQADGEVAPMTEKDNVQPSIGGDAYDVEMIDQTAGPVATVKTPPEVADTVTDRVADIGAGTVVPT